MQDVLFEQIWTFSLITNGIATILCF